MRRSRPTSDQTLTFLVRGASLVIVLAGLHFSKPVLAPLVVSTLLAFALTPIANHVERHVRVRSLSIAIVVFFVISAALSVSWFVVSQVAVLQEQWPQYSHNIRERVVTVYDQVQSLKQNLTGGAFFRGAQPPGSDPMRGQIASSKLPESPTPPEAPVPLPIFEGVSSILFSLVSYLVFILTVSVFTIFLLIGRRDIRDRWIRFIGGPDIPATTRVVDETSRKVGRYLGAQGTVNLIFGSALSLSLWLVGIPQPLLWGAVSVLLRFVPFVGGVLSAIAPILLSFAVDPTWTTPLYTLFAYLLIDLSISQFVEPVFIGRQVGVSGFALLLAAAFWTATWGVTGLIISTPVTVSLVSMGRYVAALNFMAILFGDDEVLEPAERMYHRLLSNDLNDVQDIIRSAVPSPVEPGMLIPRLLDALIFPTLVVAKRDFDEARLSGGEYRLVLRRIGGELAALSPDSASTDGATGRRLIRVTVTEASPQDGPIAALVRRSLSASGFRVSSLSPHTRKADGIKGSRVGVLITSSSTPDRRVLRRVKAIAHSGISRVVILSLGGSHEPLLLTKEVGSQVELFIARSAEALVLHLDGRSVSTVTVDAPAENQGETLKEPAQVIAGPVRLDSVKSR